MISTHHIRHCLHLILILTVILPTTDCCETTIDTIKCKFHVKSINDSSCTSNTANGTPANPQEEIVTIILTALITQGSSICPGMSVWNSAAMMMINHKLMGH